MKTALGLCALVLLFASTAGEAWAVSPVGRIVGIVENQRAVETASSAKVFRSSGGEWVPAAKGLAIFDGDEITSGAAVLRVEYADRGEVLIQARTHVRLMAKSPAGGRGIAVTVGEIFGTVRERFNVVGKGVNGAVEGTKFDVTVSGERTAVTVLEGKVRVSNRLGGVLVGPLQTSAATAIVPPMAPQRVAESEIRRIIEWTAALKSSTQTVLVVKPNYADATRRSDDFKRYSLEATLKPQSLNAHRALGDVHMDWGEPDAALEHFQVVVRNDPTDGISRHKIGLVYAQMRRHQKAAEYFREAIRLDPSIAVAHNSLGLTLRALGSEALAATEFQTAITLRPDFAEAYTNLGVAYLELKGPAAASEFLEKAAALDPTSAYVANNLGTGYFRLKAYDHAVRAFRRAIDLDPTYSAPRQNLGVLLTEQGELAKAVAELDAAVRLAPEVASIRSNLGVASMGLRQFDKAIEQLREALRLDPALAQARNNLVIAYFQAGQLQAALAECQQALARNADDPEIHELMGHTLLRLGQDHAALNAYQKAVALGFRRVSVFRGVGHAATNLKDYRQAMAAYGKALEMEPRDVPSLMNLGWIHYLQREYRESVTLSRRVAELAPDDPRGWYNLAMGHLRLAELDESMAALENAIARDGQRVFVRDALAELDAALKDDPGLRWGYFALGVLYTHLGQRPEDAAIRAFETFLRKEGSSKWADQAQARLKELGSPAR